MGVRTPFSSFLPGVSSKKDDDHERRHENGCKQPLSGSKLGASGQCASHCSGCGQQRALRWSGALAAIGLNRRTCSGRNFFFLVCLFLGYSYIINPIRRQHLPLQKHKDSPGIFRTRTLSFVKNSEDDKREVLYDLPGWMNDCGFNGAVLHNASVSRAHSFDVRRDVKRGTGLESLIPQRIVQIDPKKEHMARADRVPFQGAPLTDGDLMREFKETRAFMQKTLKKDPRLKPADMVTSFDHIDVCTSCRNYEGVQKTLHASPVVALGEHPELLMDDYAIESWKNIIRFQNRPDSQQSILRPIRKKLLRPRCPCSVVETEKGYRMYFSALIHESLTGRRRDDAIQAFAESEDGISGWTNPEQIRFPLWKREEDRTIAIYNFKFRNASRKIKFVAGYQGDAGQSCIAGSVDGIEWKPLAHPSDKGTYECSKSYLGRAGDTYIVPLYDSKRDRELVWYREDFGTKSGWREIRGVQVVEVNRTFEHMEKRGTGIRKKHAKWYLDRLGKLERFRRQIYSITWTELHPGFFVGLITVIEWAKDESEKNGDHYCAYERDTSNIYLVTSRDGIHVDDEWIYAHQPLIPKGRLQQDWNSGFMMAAAQVVTSKDKKEHRVYFEARQSRHERRYSRPGLIGVATWPINRMVGLRPSDPMFEAVFVTKGLRIQNLGSKRLVVNLDTSNAGSKAIFEILDGQGNPVREASGKNAVPIQGSDAEIEVQWGVAAAKNSNNTKVAKLDPPLIPVLSQVATRHKVIKLRVTLFGLARLYSFEFRNGV